MEKIGLIPAAGIARRLGSLAFSKELLPIDLDNHKGKPNLKAVSTYLFEKLYNSDVKKVYTVIRKGKWDIPNHYGDGSEFGIHLAYLIMNHPYGVPYTVDQAYPFINKAKIFLGFPDILFRPDNAFTIAENVLEQKSADIILGVYPVKDKSQIKHYDMVQLGAHGHIAKIVIKQESMDLKYSWVFAIWKPAFTRFMNEYLKYDLVKRQKMTIQTEIHLGHVIQAAIEKGFAVLGHAFNDYYFIDVGSPANYTRALKESLVGK